MSPLTSLLTSPRQFFEQRERDLATPALVVVAIVVVRVASAVVDSLLLTPQLTRQMGGPAQNVGLGAVASLVGGVFTAVVGPLIAWVLFAAIFYGMTELLAEEATGDFVDVLAVTAWGFVPRLLTLVVALVLSVVAVVLLGPLGLGASLVTFVLVVGPVVGLLLTLLSAYVWGNGLAVVRNVTPKQGYIAVAPVVVIGLLFTALGILFQVLGAVGFAAM